MKQENDTATAELPVTLSHAKPAKCTIQIADITVSAQVRTVFDDDSIAELAKDITARGILSPLILRNDNGILHLVAGERRMRAAILAGFTEIPADVYEWTATEAHAAQLAENIQREDLSTADRVAAIRSLFDQLKTASAVADTVHKSKSWVSKHLALSMPGIAWQAQRLIENGTTDDIELVKIVSDITNLSYADGSSAAQAVTDGKLSRTAAREILKTCKQNAAILADQRKKALDDEAKEAEEAAKRPKPPKPFQLVAALWKLDTALLADSTTSPANLIAALHPHGSEENERIRMHLGDWIQAGLDYYVANMDDLTPAIFAAVDSDITPMHACSRFCWIAGAYGDQQATVDTALTQAQRGMARAKAWKDTQAQQKNNKENADHE